MNTSPLRSSLRVAAKIFASTTSPTYVKSLLWLPSLVIVNGLPSNICFANIPIAKQYPPSKLILSPYTLKYRNEHVSKLYTSENILQYTSPTYFCTPYGDNGSILVDSGVGNIVVSPYAELEAL